MQIDGFHIGVCSWSLKPRGMADLVTQMRRLELSHVQLDLGPLLMLDDKPKHAELGHLRESGLTLTAGMISFPGEDYSSIGTIRETGGLLPDSQWPLRKALAVRAGRLASEMGARMLTLHVGFIPASNQPQYDVIRNRTCEIVSALEDGGVELLMETGQESAPELLQFLNDLRCRGVNVNFDVANMILYGAGDPIDAIGTLGRHIRHVHVKDGMLSDQPGVRWGKEVPFGTGQVSPAHMLAALKEVEYRGPLVIECEGNGDRTTGIRTAISALQDAAAELKGIS